VVGVVLGVLVVIDVGRHGSYIILSYKIAKPTIKPSINDLRGDLRGIEEAPDDGSDHRWIEAFTTKKIETQTIVVFKNVEHDI